ncbi:hypothetical protein ACHAWF_009905 [Thalassiosira exigua]
MGRGYRRSNHYTSWNCGGSHHGNDCWLRCKNCGGKHRTSECRGGRKKRKQGLAGHTVDELKKLCKERGIPVSGTKATLIARLDRYFASNPVAPRAASAASTAAAAARSRENEDYAALFDVDDDDDAAMAEAAAAFETSQPYSSFVAAAANAVANDPSVGSVARASQAPTFFPTSQALSRSFASNASAASSASAPANPDDISALFDVEEDKKPAATFELSQPSTAAASNNRHESVAANVSQSPTDFDRKPAASSTAATPSQPPMDLDRKPAAADGATDLSLNGVADCKPPAAVTTNDPPTGVSACVSQTPSDIARAPPAVVVPTPRWEIMKAKELKEACKKLGLKVSGRKDVLIARLKEHDAVNRPRPASVSPAASDSGASATASSSASSSASASASASVSASATASATAIAAVTLSRRAKVAAPPVAAPSTGSPRSDATPAAAADARAAWSPSFLVPSRASSPSAAGSSSRSSAGAGASEAWEVAAGEAQKRVRSDPEESRQKKARLSSSRDAGADERKSPPATVDAGNGVGQVKREGKTELTEAEKERARLNKEKAMRRREELQKRRAEQRRASNPYLNRPAVKRIEGGMMDRLGPMPPGLPPVRQKTLDKLSEQQLQVILAARPPAPLGNQGGSERAPAHPMVRVNAAAGTGKTTTLLHLAARSIDLGHEALSYVAFSRACAKDARDRILATLDESHHEKVTATTIHSCALRLLDRQSEEDLSEEEEDRRIMNDVAFQNVIRECWGKAIEGHNQTAVEHLRSRAKEDEVASGKLAEKERMLFEKSLFYLSKSFVMFCKSERSVEEQKDGPRRHYYPVTFEFKEGGPAAKLGFPSSHYSKPSTYSFFADTVAEIWDYVLRQGIHTFDTIIKRAQLMMLRIPCTVLLVDESQDLDKCQATWIAAQKEFGTHIFFVGDSAQCIFQFRQAKSSNVMMLDCIDTQLTKSWRFGPDIARIANIPLFAKEMSVLTTGEKRTWIPYRVEGEGGTTGVEGGRENEEKVTTKSLLKNWQKYKPLTLIGRSNAGLMVKAMDLLGLGGLKSDSDTLPEEGVRSIDSEGSSSISDLEEIADTGNRNLPKFHINGKGSGSGKGKWGTALREIRHLYELYSNRDESGYLPMALPVREFPDFVNEGPVTWDTFRKLESAMVKDIHRYNVAVNMIATYQQNTLQAMNAFESHVIGQCHSEEEADIIFSMPVPRCDELSLWLAFRTTCHSAKGLEWDYVEICDDIFDLSATSFTESQMRLRHPSFLKAMPDLPSSDASLSLGVSTGDVRKGWQFDLDRKDSDVNLLYVAITRARKKLFVPNSIRVLLQDIDRFHFLVENMKKDATGADGRKVPSSSDESMFMMEKKSKVLTKGEVWGLYHDLCVPLRGELGVPENKLILSTLFPECADDCMKSKFTEEQKEFDANAEERSLSTVPSGDNVADFFDV